MLSDTGKVKENRFSSVDMLLMMETALDFDKKNKNKTEVEHFIRKFETLCSALKETKKDNYGFYWEFYAPYFVEMKDRGLIEPFAYVAFASSDEKDVEKWLESHESELEKFFNWSEGFVWKRN